MDNNELYTKVGALEAGMQHVIEVVEDLKAMLKDYFTKNDNEHRCFATKDDLKGVADKVRELEARLAEPDKEKLKALNGAWKYILTFIGSAAFFYLLSNLGDFIAFITRSK
jgi:hypothetical protein